MILVHQNHKRYGQHKCNGRCIPAKIKSDFPKTSVQYPAIKRYKIDRPILAGTLPTLHY